MINITKIENNQLLDMAFEIRREVFVEEQQVPAEEEYDEFETISHHVLASYNDVPCGTARWRFTQKGIKLERFAVLKPYRGKGVGQKLVAAILNDIKIQANTSGKLLYLHAQLSAMPLYSKFGFIPQGEMFEEYNIQHYKMVNEMPIDKNLKF